MILLLLCTGHEPSGLEHEKAGPRGPKKDSGDNISDICCSKASSLI
jgi:hypothetical protein